MPNDFISLGPQGTVMESVMGTEAKNDEILSIPPCKVDHAGRRFSCQQLTAKGYIFLSVQRFADLAAQVIHLRTMAGMRSGADVHAVQFGTPLPHGSQNIGGSREGFAREIGRKQHSL